MLKRIEEMRREQALIAEQVKQLASKESKGEQLTKEDVAQFQSLQTNFEELGSQISRAETAEQMTAATAAPINNVSSGMPAVHVKKAPKDYAGAKVARFAMAIAAAENNMDDAAKFAENEIGDKEVAMAISTASNSGGALIPENIASEIIELLRPKTVVRALGAQSVPLVNGNLTIPRITGGATSNYKGENNAQNAEGGSTDDVKLSAKTQMSIVPMSNELIGKAGFRVESIFLNDMISAIANRQDKAWLRDDGTNDTPTGFRKVATDSGRTIAWTGTADLATIDAYLDSLILGLMNSDSNMIMAGWALAPRSFMKLQGLRDGNNNKVYPEMANGFLKGWPIKHTTNIPVNLGAGTDETEIYFADWNDVIIGETDEFTIDFSREATYNDASGTLVSAYSKNQSVLRVVTGNDVGFRHLEGLQLGTGITW
jgi:HK97 family phage major capsid protein